ncbi:hypothetical protein BC937DRAFT_92243 [Endogone sp. FLAS-F59071]|nr:hypothetical protein BC937DRAFT_92243 [Endogone sp. FLAS-F59071]|eukprot:RUS15600.1 hypothetical protein BC937DRAFT_92243 [Endogone sp. FLAS-F59071]
MALPVHLRSAFTPAEIEFSAENILVFIVPSYRMDAISLITGTYGPFRPPARAEVPLWLALALKKNQKCTILPPEWLTVENLQSKLQEEETGPNFSALPYHYMEVAHLLLEDALDDIPSADRVRKLLKDLRETRQSKAREGLGGLTATYLQMDNLSLMEINEIRPFFIRAFNEMRRLQFDEEPEGEGGGATMAVGGGRGSS